MTEPVGFGPSELKAYRMLVESLARLVDPPRGWLPEYIAENYIAQLRANGLRILPEGHIPTEAAAEMLGAVRKVLETLDPKRPHAPR